MKKLALMTTIILLNISPAKADCYCACIGGINQPICTGSFNIEPICPIAICP